MSASPRQPRNWLALLLSVITGLGHFYLDHYRAGAILFGLFVTTLNGVFLGFTLQATTSPELLRAVSIFGFVVVWTFGLWHAYRLSYGTDRPALARAKDQLLREGLIDYLRDDLEDAARKLERAAALDVDWLDPDPLFHLGVVSARLAERREARGDHDGARRARRRALSSFRACLSRDPLRKWRAEVGEELRHMERSPFSGLRKLGGALRSALTSVSGLLVRPSSAALRGPDPGAGSPTGGTEDDLKAAHVRAAIVQTRKKKRFSAKYPALPRPEGQPRTHADLAAGVATPASGPEDPPPETRPDLDLGAPDSPADAPPAGALPADAPPADAPPAGAPLADAPPADAPPAGAAPAGAAPADAPPAGGPGRSEARRFPLADITQALALHDGQLSPQLPPPSSPPADAPQVTLQPAVVEEPEADAGDEGERDEGERDEGERDVGERDAGERGAGERAPGGP